MKQTAVEWYNLKVIELMTQREQENIDVLEFRNQLDLLLTQAKEMEKEQMIDAFVDGADKGYTIHLPDNEVLGEPKQEQRKMIMKKLKQIGKELIALTALILCLILIPNPIMYLIGCWQLGSWFGYLTKKL
jgi:hypothetical protein